jgi:2Fe-2S ferredoxin
MRVEPAGINVEVRPGETLMRAAWRAGYDWPTLCYAMGRCTACQCEVLEGLHVLSERTQAESALLSGLDRRVRRVNPRRVRLACQVTVTGDVTVRKPGVKKQTASSDERTADARDADNRA